MGKVNSFRFFTFIILLILFGYLSIVQPDLLTKLFSGRMLGSFFEPKKVKLSSRKCWIGYTLKPEGVIYIDDGAISAILHKGKSILPIGIISVQGDFGIGAPVEFASGNNEKLGIGLVNYSSADINKIKGLRTNQIKGCLGYKPYDEVIHRDNLMILTDKGEENVC